MKNKRPLMETISLIYQNANCVKNIQGILDIQRNRKIEANFSLYGKENHCTFTLGKGNSLLTKSCDCHWFAEYQDCPHLRIAQELVKEYGKEYPFTLSNDKLDSLHQQIDQYQERLAMRKMKEHAESSKQLLNKFMNMYDTQLKLSVEEITYDIEPYMQTEHTWELSFKVGNEKKYVIKSILGFLQNIDEQKEVAYGKKLSFIHRESMFSESAKQTIAFMRRHMQKLQNEYYDSSSKTFLLRDSLLDDFFTLYENDTYPSFVLETIGEQIGVSVTKKDDYYIFHMDKKQKMRFGEKHLYFVQVAGKITKINRILLDEEGITALFLKQLAEEDFVIAAADYPKFYKYVLLTALQFIDMTLPITIDEERMERAELYGDIDDQNRIYFYLYCYGASNIRYFGFDEKRVTSYEQDCIELYIRKYASLVDEKNHLVYMDENEDSTLDFISDGLPYLSQFCDIYVSDALKSLGKSQSYHIQVGVRYTNELLALDFKSLDIPKEELAAVLSAYKKKKKFHRLKNGKLLSLQSDDLAELNDFLDGYHISHQELQKGKLTLAPYRMFSLEEQAKESKLLQIQREKSFTKHLNEYYECKNNPIPEKYEAILRDYQKEGFQWLSIMRQYGFNGILADDMGLGKTLQVIALLEANRSSQSSLVVCPASLIYNWEEEVHKFTDGLSVVCITGTQEERNEKIAKYKDTDLLITSYDYMRRDVLAYEEIAFDTVILDEAQYIKNPKTKNAMAVKQLHAAHRIALTGTPIENSLSELWSIFDFLMPDYLFNYHYFQKQYETDIVKNKDEEKQRALRKLVTPFILRRNKKDVLKELPDKIEEVRKIDFSEEEQKLYLANVAEVNQELNMMGDAKNNKLQILAMLTKLRQICCEPRLVYENIDHMSSKLVACLELIEELHENHQKILLFSTFTSILDLLANELKRKQISFYQLTGKTNKEQRKELVQKFQQDDTCIFLISLKAGGTGLNLTAAEAVIHFDPWWNQSAQNQATDRAYRIGQGKNVQVFKFIMKDSIEEKIQELQEQKKELADAFVENNEGKITSMNKEEIMELFK